jgi:glycosyltransferase involved in cell wall biosynthesis
VPDGASKTALEEYGASFIVPPDDIDAIMNALIKINELYKKNMLPQPNVEFIERHDRSKLTEQLAKQFQFFLKEEI